MIDERKEFQCYTVFPEYRTASVKDTAFLNRISFLSYAPDRQGVQPGADDRSEGIHV